MEVFVFPLVNVTLFPHTIKPLHVFEARYLTLIQEAIASKTPVAIAYIDDPALVVPVSEGEKITFVREIAGYGRPEIIEERLNGTLLIFLHGEGKVRLGPVLKRDRPYLICEADLVHETQELLPTKQSRLEALSKILYRWIQDHIPDQVQREIFLRSVRTPEEIVGSFAAYLVRDYDLQQMALEFDDINEKVEFLFRLTQSNELSSY